MTEFRYPRFVRWLNLAGALFMFGFAFIGWMAYSVEGATVGLFFAVLLAGIGVYWLYALAASAYAVSFGADTLTIRRWLGRRELPYAKIRGVTQSYRLITLQTVDGDARIHKLFANQDVLLVNALERHIPAARIGRKARLSGDLPIELRAGWTAAGLSLLFGLILLTFGLGAVTMPLLDWQNTAWNELVCMPLIGLISAGFGGLFIYMTLWHFVRHTVFTTDELIEVGLLRTRRRTLRGITAIDPGYTERSVRGVARRVYHIDLLFVDGNSLRWVPNEFDFPMDYIDARAASLVNEMTVRLRKAYLGLET